MTRSSLSSLSRYSLLLAGTCAVLMLNLMGNILTVSETGGTYGATSTLITLCVLLQMCFCLELESLQMSEAL